MSGSKSEWTHTKKDAPKREKMEGRFAPTVYLSIESDGTRVVEFEWSDSFQNFWFPDREGREGRRTYDGGDGDGFVLTDMMDILINMGKVPNGEILRLAKRV